MPVSSTNNAVFEELARYRERVMQDMQNRRRQEYEMYYTLTSTPGQAWSTTTNVVNPADGMVYWGEASDEPTAQSKAAQTRKLQADEKAWLGEFIKTGSSDHLELVLNNRGKLYVMGNHIKGATLMFVLDKRQITVHSERSKHLLSLLTGLADREGLKLNAVREFPAYNNRGNRQVAFWAFKHREEVDDSNLVARIQPLSPVAMREEIEADIEADDEAMPEVVRPVWQPFNRRTNLWS